MLMRPPYKTCPNGKELYHTLMRGSVVRSKRAWYWPFRRRPEYAVICLDCKEIVGWEYGTSQSLRWAENEINKRRWGIEREN